MSDDEQIARLTGERDVARRERDLARTLAVEAMRTMTDGQLLELRGAMDRDIDELVAVDNHQLKAMLEACGSISTDPDGTPGARSASR